MFNKLYKNIFNFKFRFAKNSNTQFFSHIKIVYALLKCHKEHVCSLSRQRFHSNGKWLFDYIHSHVVDLLNNIQISFFVFLYQNIVFFLPVKTKYVLTSYVYHSSAFSHTELRFIRQQQHGTSSPSLSVKQLIMNHIYISCYTATSSGCIYCSKGGNQVN